MIVLGQNSIIESHPVVVSPSASRCVFFQRPEPRSGFASVKKPYPMLFDQADETFCQGCDPTEFLEEIQGRPFDQENLCLRTDQGSDGLARLSFGSIVRTFTQDNLTCAKSFCDEGNELDSTDDHSLAGYNHGLAFARYIACVRGDVHCLRGTLDLSDFFHQAKPELGGEKALIELIPRNSLLELSKGGRRGVHVFQETEWVKLSSAMSFSVVGTSEMICPGSGPTPMNRICGSLESSWPSG